MISSKQLIKMARKWQKLTAISRKRITFPRITGATTSEVTKGHFVVYASDQRRFVIPLVYLENSIFRELLAMAEEVYGLPRDGPITIPCDAIFMDYAVSLIRRKAAKDLEKALIMSLTTSWCSSPLYYQQEESNQQLLVCSV